MPAKGYRKHDAKSDRVIIRVTADEKARWESTADYYGFKSVSDMMRRLAEQLNVNRVCEEIMEEVEDVEIGEGIII